MGYSIDVRMTSALAVDALRNAITLRGALAPTVEQTPLRPVAGFDGPGRHLRGKHRDGTFFALRQKNVLNRPRWSTRAELRLAVVSWIETTYHRRRRQQSPGRLTPVEFERLLDTAHAA